MRVITDIPTEKLGQLIEDLAYGSAALIRIERENPKGWPMKWKVEYRHEEKNATL